MKIWNIRILNFQNIFDFRKVHIPLKRKYYHANCEQIEMFKKQYLVKFNYYFET